ncbi:MAG: serine/threonine protein kinase [Myxococcales bacterium]|nr:serine/threonine protein kinase [Myxococcales bacterium]MCB9579773.1 serine/threonine protein kinase [Polyangiaceae bacterium]
MSSVPPPAQLAPGARLDRYELLAPIAQGGMAQVWVARLTGHHGFERLVAIKTILSQHAADPRFQRMFLDEARIIANIHHPNVAQILDLGEQVDLLYLVLEWIEGDSVSALRRVVHGSGEKLPLGIVLRIVSDTLNGLHAAHEVKSPDGTLLGVVHRDVSPANVLVSHTGEVKVIDFGVAKAVDRLSEETSAGVIKGKVAYMAPEQALGRDVDRRADIWAAGVMLYQLLSGRTPYEGDNQLATLARLVKGMPPEPLRGVPNEVAEVVYTALCYEPNGRYATADEMHRALETLIIQLCGPTTQTDVAAYVSSKLAERLARRKKMVSRALDAAEQRSELAAEFESSVTHSSSIAVMGDLKTPTGDRAMLAEALERASREPPPQPLPAAGTPPPPALTQPAPPQAQPARPPVDLEALARESLDSEPNFGTRRRAPIIAIGFAAALVLLGYGAWLAYDRISTERELSAPPTAQ